MLLCAADRGRGVGMRRGEGRVHAREKRVGHPRFSSRFLKSPTLRVKARGVWCWGANFNVLRLIKQYLCIIHFLIMQPLWNKRGPFSQYIDIVDFLLTESPNPVHEAMSGTCDVLTERERSIWGEVGGKR